MVRYMSILSTAFLELELKECVLSKPYPVALQNLPSPPMTGSSLTLTIEDGIPCLDDDVAAVVPLRSEHQAEAVHHHQLVLGREEVETLRAPHGR